VLSYLSKTPGVEGAIKKNPEDFLVEEIRKDGAILKLDKKIKKKESKGDFTYFILQKRNWDTMQALRVISSKLHCSVGRFNYAGVKDRVAITTQLVSGYKVDKKQLLNLKIKDIKINGAWLEKEKLRIGDLLGNKFQIVVRDVEVDDAKNRIKRILNELQGIAPNYFGEQRFGSIRKNTHLVGKAIVSGNFKDAVWCYLTYMNDNESENGKEARKQLAAEGDFKKALNYFPNNLKYERILLNHLSSYPNDYVNAIRKLPRGLSLMFVHAYQSHIFNKILSKKVSQGEITIKRGDMVCGKDKFGFPNLKKIKKAERKIEIGKYLPVGRIIGYETGHLNDDEREVLQDEGINKKCFFIKSSPELSSKGTTRCFFIFIEKLKFKSEIDKLVFNFPLPAGAYATVAMREFIDRK
jgi:tRNA pseudouridine13 synthase